MGRFIKFRRRPWTKARAYGAPKPLRFWPDPNRVTVRGLVRDTWWWLKVLRPFILTGILLGIWPAADPALIEPPQFLSTGEERVSASFTRCGPGRGLACVIDGDTFKLGERKIRVIGIDTPETHPARCAEEARLGEQATARLQALLNQGQFEMSGWAHNRRDRYGRELMAITRPRPDGSTQSIAADMRTSGLARRYAGGFKLGWC